jgi:hypothetical protein
MKTKPSHAIAYSLALMGSGVTMAAEGVNLDLNSFKSSLAPLFGCHKRYLEHVGYCK